MNRLIVDLLPFLPRGNPGVLGASHLAGSGAEGGDGSDDNLRGSLLLAGAQISDALVQTVVKRLVGCAELAKLELLPGGAAGGGGSGPWIERVVWQVWRAFPPSSPASTSPPPPPPRLLLL